MDSTCSGSAISSPPPSADNTIPSPVSIADKLKRKEGTKAWPHKYFHVYVENERLAKCDICSQDIKWGDAQWGNSTSSLTSHIRKMHRNVYDAELAKQAAAVAAAAAASEALPKQQVISTYFTGSTKDTQDRAHLKFIIDCGLPKGTVLTVRTVSTVLLLTNKLFLRYGGEGIFQRGREGPENYTGRCNTLVVHVL